MRIHGLQKLTLLDYPGHTACTVFTGSCNFRCPFCQNASLVLHPSGQPEIPEDEILAYLRKRQGLLDGVCITGGEPTVQSGLEEFIREVRALGFHVKLDTNGTAPELLRHLLEQGLLDYVAMDIKTCRENYAAVCGVEGFSPDSVAQSAALLLTGKIPYEFRTTVVRELHRVEDIRAAAEWLQGAQAYYLQQFRDSGDLIRPGLSACGREELEAMRRAALPFIPNTFLRGVD